MATNPDFRPVRSPLTTEGLAGTIYGTVTAMAVIAAVSEYNTSTGDIALSAIGTVLALSISHGYANWIGMRPSRRPSGDFKLVVSHEWPIIAASLIVALTLIVPRLLGANEGLAIDISLWAGTAMLFAFGFRAAQRSGRAVKACIMLATFDSLIGAVIVTLKSAVH